MFVGSTIQLNGRQNEIGSTVRCYARTGTSSTDLRLLLLSTGLRTNQWSATESAAKEQVTIVTNLQTAFRIQIPKGKGVVLVAGRGLQHGVASAGILISPPQ